MDLLTRIASELAPFLSAPRWIVALSGGVDSVALLHLIARFRADHPNCPRIHALHINHGLQTCAADWEALCTTHCEILQIPLTIVGVSLAGERSSGVEAAAREARYAAFRDALKGGGVLLQAHHADDQAETVLFRLLRGAGPRGLAGIPAVRSLGEGVVLRPLLGRAKAELTEYCEVSGLEWIDDPSNESTGYDRNFLRKEVLPLIEARWPGYRTTLGRAASIQRQVMDDLLETSVEVKADLFGDIYWHLPDDLKNPIADVSVLASWLHARITAEGIMAPPVARLFEFARQILAAGEDRQPLLEFDGAVLRAWRGRVYCCRVEYFDEATNVPAADATNLCVPEECVIREVTIHWTAADYGLPQGTALRVGSIAPGEQLALLNGKTKPFKQLCQERGIPPWRRGQLAGFYLADNLIAVVGLGFTRAAQSYLVAGGWRPAWGSAAV